MRSEDHGALPSLSTKAFHCFALWVELRRKAHTKAPSMRIKGTNAANLKSERIELGVSPVFCAWREVEIIKMMKGVIKIGMASIARNIGQIARMPLREVTGGIGNTAMLLASASLFISFNANRGYIMRRQLCDKPS